MSSAISTKGEDSSKSKLGKPHPQQTVGLADLNVTLTREAVRPFGTSVVCGTDFSRAATEAVEVAGLIAKKSDAPLILVHATNPRNQISLPGGLNDSLCLYARAQLHEERERLHQANVDAVEVFCAGKPEQILLKEVDECCGKLLVLADQNKAGFLPWPHATLSERISETAGAPTLVIRKAAPLSKWLTGRGKLRVLVGADFSRPSKTALDWVRSLQALGTCDIVVAYLEPPPIVNTTFGDRGSVKYYEVDFGTSSDRQKAFRSYVHSILGDQNVRIEIGYEWTFSDVHLVEMALREKSDLIVVGTHSRTGWGRFGHHSVSRGVLRHASTNVACVPVQKEGATTDQSQI